MSGEASTIPLRGGGAAGRAHGWLARGRIRELLGADQRVRAGVLALAVIVILSFVLVLMAADRPSVLAATSHTGFYPRWMAGPLGGLWPGLTREPNMLKYLFTGGVAVMYIAYIFGFKYASLLPARVVIGAIVAVHVIFLLAPPMALTDVFNYVNYGRMEVVHHLNPYTSIPILEPHSDPAFALSNWHQLLSPYGPLFTMLTFAVVPLGVAASFWVLKLILGLCSLAVLVLVWRCARLTGRNPLAAITFVGLNPIVLVWGLGGDHNDFLMMLFIVLGFYLLLQARARAAGAAPAPAPRQATPRPASLHALGSLRRALSARGRLSAALLPLLSGREVAAGAAFVTAVAIKASAAVLVPIVLVAALRSRRTLVSFACGMLAAGAVVGVASLFAFGLHIPDLNTQSALVTNESVPNLVGLAVGAGGENGTVRAAMTALLAVVLLASCWQAWRTRDPIAPCGWTSVTLLVTLSWVLPWYVIWALPMAALSSSPRLRAACLVVGVYLIVAWAPASGLLWKAIGFHPEKTPLGHLHQRYVKELLN